MLEMQDYLETLLGLLRQAFGSRLLYLGLQGSYRRGEADENSDVDAMVVLDRLSVEDLALYRRLVAQLPQPEKSCGFLCGKEELAHWNACEICQLLHETQDVYGALAPLLPAFTADDVRMQVKIGAGNLYHEICHRYVHASQEENIQGLRQSYKAVFYLLQNLYYCKTGAYAATKKELLARLHGPDREVLQTAIALRQAVEYNFKSAYQLLFDWCQMILQTT